MEIDDGNVLSDYQIVGVVSCTHSCVAAAAENANTAPLHSTPNSRLGRGEKNTMVERRDRRGHQAEMEGICQ